MINLIGLIMGISAAFLLSKYVGFYLTADDFQENSGSIFAVHQTLTDLEGAKTYTDRTYQEVAQVAKEQFPEVKASSRFNITGETLVSTIPQNGEPLKFNEMGIVEADPDFLRMFTLRFLQGNPDRALDEPGSIIMTASMALKYFGKDNPIGKTLITKKAWGSKSLWTIRGVIEDYPANSQFQFDFIQSLSGKEFDETEHGWTYPNIKSYLFLENPTKKENVEAKMTNTINGLAFFSEAGKSIEFHLASLAEETSLTSSQKLFILIGVVLLLITWINYTNLSGAKSLTRGKEFGVRRVIGSDKRSLIRQFLLESLVIYGLALMAVAVMVISLYPVLFDLTGGQLLPILEFDTPINLAFLLFLLVGAVVSSIYPSFSIYSYSLTGLLKSGRTGSSRSRSFQKILVVFQFTVSIIMLVGIATVYRQMKFIRNQETGFDIDQILIIKAPKDQWEGKIMRMRSFKNELKDRPFSRSVTSSSTVPLWWPGSPTDFNLKGKRESLRLIKLRVDEAYFNCYGLDLVAGEAFRTGQNQTNRKKVLVNELTAKKLGFARPEEALNQRLFDQKDSKEVEIIGVVKDHHHESLRRDIKPQVFEFGPNIGFVSVNLHMEETAGLAAVSGALENIRALWNEIYPDQAFDYYFLDDRFHNIYEEERMFQQMFLVFTLISVIITFLGVFGLSMFVSIRRKKEIGIRKVLGARPIQIVGLFSREFMSKAGISILIGIPLAYYLLNLWLANFKYRISFDFWMVILPCLVLGILTLLSLSFESAKMTRTNPVKMLRED